ncbi:cell envelope integrity protein TolA [Salinimicrobium gaetbulicola]|uniref:Cell envelope integrity protein TolA n=1 Tax=Salinimicrobium gaetbulicola TaxID=999702 RepID=A0ABW3ICY9_9FLAO
MKKLYLFFALVVVGFSTHAFNASEDYRNGYRDAFIFVEGGVEFAVYPDGQFDFFYNPRRTGYNVNVATPHINFSYNSGYNYDPYVQYDDYGAVIQIEDVPIYYDYYGRIIQAGHVRMSYNHFGMLARVGHLHLHYNHYNRYTHYSGYINSHNPYYVYRPWHRHYSRPSVNLSIVFNQPYRAHYHPNRMKYRHYKNYYKKHHHKKDFRRRYYSPGDRVVSYQRGRRLSDKRDLRNERHYYDEPVRTRSNANTGRDRKVYATKSHDRNVRQATGPNSRDSHINTRRDRQERAQNNSRRERVQNDRRSVSQQREHANRDRRQVHKRETQRRTEAKRPARSERRQASTRNEVKKERTSKRAERATRKESKPRQSEASASRNSRSNRGRE